MITQPKHLAIILDGNQRWSKKNNKNINQGYESGFNKIFELTDWCIDYNIKYLTIFTLSSENIKRKNINILLNLIDERNPNFKKALNNKKIKMKFVGNLNIVKPKIKTLFNKIEERTINNYELNLNIAFASTIIKLDIALTKVSTVLMVNESPKIIIIIDKKIL